MSSDAPTDDAGAAGDPAAAEPEWRRRRRLDAIFGDSGAEVVSDPGEAAHTGYDRDWYERNRPPHHE
ncbi:hypothetical protein GOHSU_19_00670 [Gordonia hirsuta DSM 44140 = NBRC 16056]|uniref:Uncharacterized protein n=1 Tax=Gordonia hirsuta DSM 44140 = NBRC 16056 TaxID=1121927 RepID=L7LBP0_9ACTN|nr:hypothetical protein [Gordonia hirsuta]GAC57462.1 hypothetical protein GOHSU_19_00670 [Gordonia hirsuta DSM 44140 = NBRC 16056]